MFNSLTCEGLEYAEEAKRREKLKHVLNQWYSAYQQATLGKVATAYDELECMVGFISVIEEKTLSHILLIGDVCCDGLVVRGRKKQQATKLVNVLNETSLGCSLTDPLSKLQGWEKRVLAFLEEHGELLNKMEGEMEEEFAACDVDIYDKNGRLKKKKNAPFLKFINFVKKTLKKKMRLYQLSTVTGLLCGFTLSECRAYYGCGKKDSDIE